MKAPRLLSLSGSMDFPPAIGLSGPSTCIDLSGAATKFLRPIGLNRLDALLLLPTEVLLFLFVVLGLECDLERLTEEPPPLRLCEEIMLT